MDEVNETETDDETSAPLVTSPPTTTTSTMTTTTPRPVITTLPPPQDTHDRKDLRSYEVSIGPLSNGLQQPAHVAHKWQSLNTHDGTKDYKAHGPQTNRNGKCKYQRKYLKIFCSSWLFFSRFCSITCAGILDTSDICFFMWRLFALREFNALCEYSRDYTIYL